MTRDSNCGSFAMSAFGVEAVIGAGAAKANFVRGGVIEACNGEWLLYEYTQDECPSLGVLRHSTCRA